FPGLRHALRLPALGVPAAAPADQGEGGAALPVRRRQFAVRPGLPQPGTPQRGDGLVAGQRRRRARAWRDETAASGPACRGSAAPAAAAGGAVRRGGGGVPARVGGGTGGLAGELLLDAVAADRPAAGGADHGRRGDRLRAAAGRGGPASAAAGSAAGT